MALSDSTHKAPLLAWAREALLHGIHEGVPPRADLTRFAPELREHRAVFVTLEKHGQLRGCIGHLEAVQPLAQDVADQTVAAALEDPRFSPVMLEEVPELTLSISILTPPERMTIKDEADLFRQLRPGIDGLILDAGRRRATFLPSVWDELPDPRDFLMHLKRKAGWNTNTWPDGAEAWRYEAIYFSEHDC